MEVMRKMTAKEILNLIDWLRAQGFILAKIRLCFEDQPIVAPSLQVSDFLGRLFLVIDHYIG